MAEGAYRIIRQKLEKRELVILDGAIGTEIVRRGARWRQNGLRTDADTVQQIHEDYIAAGADVITTDTFQLTQRLFLNLFHNLEHMRRIGREGLESQAQELARKAVQIAKQARQNTAGGRPVAIAGSMAPLQHCFRPDLAPPYSEARKEHSHTAHLLADAGVDFILIETMNTIGEAKTAVEAALETGLPVWVSFVLGPNGEILDRSSLKEAIRVLEPLGPDAILVNCAPPEDITRGAELLASAWKGPFGAYAHIGRYDPPSWKFEFHPRFCMTEEWLPERYAACASRWRQLGATIVGGCCGTTPEHIQAIRQTNT